MLRKDVKASKRLCQKNARAGNHARRRFAHPGVFSAVTEEHKAAARLINTEQ